MVGEILYLQGHSTSKVVFMQDWMITMMCTGRQTNSINVLSFGQVHQRTDAAIQ